MPGEVTDLEYHAVCTALDNITIEFFDTLTELNNSQKHIEQHLKAGYFSMSKARYSMGNESVSTLQYDNKMQATAIVNVSNETLFNKDFIGFQLSKPDHANKKQQEDNSSNSSVRRRNVQSDTDKDVSEISQGMNSLDVGQNQEKTEDSKEKSARYVDPIKWFGVLVPQALRQSQGSFKSATEVACRAAALQTKLMALRQAYSDHMEIKRSLTKPA